MSHIHPLALMGMRVNVMTSLQLVLSVVTRVMGSRNRWLVAAVSLSTLREFRGYNPKIV